MSGECPHKRLDRRLFLGTVGLFGAFLLAAEFSSPWLRETELEIRGMT